MTAAVSGEMAAKSKRIEYKIDRLDDLRPGVKSGKTSLSALFNNVSSANPRAMDHQMKYPATPINNLAVE